VGHNNSNFSNYPNIQILSILLVILLFISACLVTSPYTNDPPDPEIEYLPEATTSDPQNGASCSEKSYEAISGTEQFTPHQLNEPGARKPFSDPISLHASLRLQITLATIRKGALLTHHNNRTLVFVIHPLKI
jgi:hypothetical protein